MNAKCNFNDFFICIIYAPCSYMTTYTSLVSDNPTLMPGVRRDIFMLALSSWTETVIKTNRYAINIHLVLKAAMERC